MRAVLVLLPLLAACATTSPTPYEPRTEEHRDTARAEELSRAAADLLYVDPERAESMLREALEADLFFGPAHNNLGVLYLSQEKPYEAAGEFEWARKLLPGHPDPRLNLALTLEQAGRWEEAAEGYASALEVYPGHPPSERALARLLVRRAPSDPRLRELLPRISLQGDSAWRSWARRAAAKKGIPGPAEHSW